MNFGPIVTLLVTTTVIPAVSADGNSHNDVILASIAALASNMNEKFDRQELKVNQIIAKQTDGIGCSREGTTIGDSSTDDSMDDRTQSELSTRLRKLNRLESLVCELVSVPACQRTAAYVPQPMILAAVNTPQNISCQSPGQELNSCVWGHIVNGTRQTIVVDRALTENNAMIAVDRVSYLADDDGLDHGNCTLTIQSVTESHEGLWSCTLMSKNSTVLSGAVHVALASPSEASHQDKIAVSPAAQCESDQMEVLKMLKNIFDEQQNCAPCPACDTIVKPKLIAAEEKLRQSRRTIKDLNAGLMAPATQKRKARVFQTKVMAKVNTSVALSCESGDGQPWSTCLWEHKSKGEQQRLLVVDQHVAQSGGRTLVDGIMYVEDGLNDGGKCELRIESLVERDYGQWKCTLVSQNKTIFTGELQVQDAEIAPSVYIATDEGGILSYSIKTSEVNQLFSSSEIIWGIAYDSIHDKLYWSTNSKIYRGNRSIGEVETVLSTSQYVRFQSLDFDWIAGNLYVATWGGYILACDTNPTRPFRCATILSGRGFVAGIALDPNEGRMYWCKDDSSASSISKSGMDGSKPVEIVTGLKDPRGIVIDVETSRLYWTCAGDSKVQSSNMQGTDVKTIIQFPSGSWPYGVTVYGGRIYCSNYSTKKLESATPTGQDLRLLHTGTNNFRHLAVVSNLTRPGNRTNHCAYRRCSNVCVLTPTSFSCMP